MARVFRKVTVRHILNGRQVPAGTPGATKKTVKSTKWYGRVGSGKPIPLAANKGAAQIMLGELMRKAEMARAGVCDPFEVHRRRPLTDHVDDYEQYLRHKGAGDKHTRGVVSHIRRIAAGCQLTFLDDISLSGVQGFLAQLVGERPQLPPIDPEQEWYTLTELAAVVGVKPHCIRQLVRRWGLAAEGSSRRRRFPRATALALRERLGQPVGPATLNHFIRAIRGFCRWLVRDRRTAGDPLAGLSGLRVDADVRRGRRALCPDELRSVLAAARSSGRAFRGLDGRARHFLYLTACTTGYRAGELAVLTPEAFTLDAEPPAVVLGAAHTKNGKTAVQPIPGDVAAQLRGYLHGKAPGRPVWPGTWHEDAAEMLCIDLDGAGIPYVVTGPDGTLLHADFHCLRHSFVAMLDRSGATLKEAMQLARHSDPKLTMARYGRAQLHDLHGAVERLPGLLSTKGDDAAAGELRPTGAEGAVAQAQPFSCTPVAQTRATEREDVTTGETGQGETAGKDDGRNPLVLREIAADGEQERAAANDLAFPCPSPFQLLIERQVPVIDFEHE
jgi:integrase